MAYKAVVDFVDLMDDGYQYKAGDVYPRSGVANESRVKILMTPTAQRGALIAEATETITAEAVEKKKSKRAEKKED